MNRVRSRPAGSVVRPLLLMLSAFPIACFTGALATDVVYTRTADMMWADFSAWLLALGMLLGVIAGVVGAVALVAHPWLRAQMRVGVVVIGSLLVLIIGLVDNLVHTRDAWTSVVPEGVVLSAVNVIVILLTAGLGLANAARPVAGVPYTGVRP